MAVPPIWCQGEARQGTERMARRNEERERRLAQALRDNLRRRKEQARDDQPPAPPRED